MRLVTVLFIAWLFENTDTEDNMNTKEERVISSGKCVEENVSLLNKTEDFLKAIVETRSVSVEIIPSKETIFQRRTGLENASLCGCTFPLCSCSRLVRFSVSHHAKREVRAVQTHQTSTSTSFPDTNTDSSYSGYSLGHFNKRPRSVDVFLRDYPYDNNNGYDQSEFSDENGPVYSELTLAEPNNLSDSEDLIPYQFQNQGDLRTEKSLEYSPSKAFSLGGVTSKNIGNSSSKYQSADSLARLALNIAKDSSRSISQSGQSNKDESLSTKTEPKEYLQAQSNFVDPLSVKLNSIIVNETKANGSDVYEIFISLHPVEDWKALGYFTEDYLHVISKHWLQFPPAHHGSHYILAVLYAIIMTVGVTGNFLVIFMFLR